MDDGPRAGQRKVPLPAALFTGFCMGCADAVPGVSGGTMALILGIYGRFIAAIDAVLGAVRNVRDAAARQALRPAAWLLVPLGVGVVTGLLLTTKLLVGKTEDPGLLLRAPTAPFCYAFFFGLVLVSIREPWRRIENRSPATVGLALAGAAVSWTVSSLPFVAQEPETWMLFPGGALAISVMLLPGISGSLLLLTINQYQAVTQAIHDRNLLKLSVFGLGVLAGVAAFVPLLRRLLARHRDATMAVLTGLMIGSLRSLWPWKSAYDYKDFAKGVAEGGAREVELLGVQSNWPYVLLLVAAGGACILALSWIEKRLLNREDGGPEESASR